MKQQAIVGTLAAAVRTLAASPALLRARPGIGVFLAGYLRKFPVTEHGGRLILHSHLPPLDSPAYSRFVRLHLLDRAPGPSHAQVAVTNACPQRCAVCYNRDRAGTPLEAAELRRAIGDLVDSGVVWLGLTGGEPLLRRDLPDLIEPCRGRCVVKLFTTGMGATRPLACRLRDAGLFSVSVSIDHWDEATHDRGRGFAGAWRAAVDGVSTFRSVDGLHVGISAVLTRADLRRAGHLQRLLDFADALGAHELWVSEAKPAVASLFDEALVLEEGERQSVAAFQDTWNAGVRKRGGGVLLNYLGHFEGGEHFGCNAGRKMVYIDPFGGVSPCVFTPFSLGNVRERPLAETLAEMRRHFPTEDRCFINRNWRLVADISGGALPMNREQALALLDRVSFGPPAAFNRRYLARHAGQA